MAAADSANAPSTQHDRLDQRVEEVQEMVGKLWARWSEVKRGSECEGARRSSRRQWRFAAGKKNAISTKTHRLNRGVDALRKLRWRCGLAEGGKDAVAREMAAATLSAAISDCAALGFRAF